MKREVVLDLLELVSENLNNLNILHSQIVGQVREIENEEFLQHNKTLQGIKSQLIKRGKYLNNYCQHKRRILLKIEENKMLWVFKQKSIVALLEQYNWDSQDKIRAIFQSWNNHLLNLEKQLSDWHYSNIKTEDLKQLIKDNLLDRFVEFNQQNDGVCDKIETVEAYNLMAEYLIAEQKQKLNLSYLQELDEKISTLSKEEKLTSFQAVPSTV